MVPVSNRICPCYLSLGKVRLNMLLSLLNFNKFYDFGYLRSVILEVDGYLNNLLAVHHVLDSCIGSMMSEKT